MGTIITWPDVLARYPELDKLPSGTAPTMQDTLIATAEAHVHGRLASKFSVPFSSSNITARDLTIDALYVQTQMARQPEKAKAVKEFLDERFEALLAGGASMVASNGTVAATMVGDTIWSSTEDYPPTFGVSDAEVSLVSSGRLYDEAVTRGDE